MLFFIFSSKYLFSSLLYYTLEIFFNRDLFLVEYKILGSAYDSFRGI